MDIQRMSIQRFFSSSTNAIHRSQDHLSCEWLPPRTSQLTATDGSTWLGSTGDFRRNDSGTCCSPIDIRTCHAGVKAISSRDSLEPARSSRPAVMTSPFPVLDGWRQLRDGEAEDEKRTQDSEHLGKSRKASAPETRSEKVVKVAVVGAGVSGIGACKILSEAGLHVDVFEARDQIGGIWSRTYESTSLQTPRTAYKFSDWDWPEETPMNPTHRQVMEYLRSYIQHFRLGPRISVNTRVAEMRRDGTGRGWQLRVQQRNGSGEEENTSVQETWRNYDYVVMCSGSFGDIPNLPTGYPPGQGPEVFQGQLLHSLDYSGLSPGESWSLLQGKRVVVVGFQKTAIDVTLEAAEANRGEGAPPTTLLFRQPHWVVPPNLRLLGVLPMKNLLFTRAAEFWYPRPNQNLLHTLLQTLMPMRQLMSAVVEAHLRHLFPLRTHNLLPSHSFLDDLSACILPQMPPKFFPLVEQGRIRLCRSPTWGFTPTGLRLSGGQEVGADCVVLCTGYDGMAKLKSILPKEYGQQLCLNGKSMYLYRGMVHPRVPDVAFLGFHEGLSSMHSAEMGARWVAKLLKGTFQLPPQEVMEKDCVDWWALKQSSTPFASRISCIAPIQSYHFDHLCRDMGWAVMRKPSLWEHWFGVYGAGDYREKEGEGVLNDKKGEVVQFVE